MWWQIIDNRIAERRTNKDDRSGVGRRIRYEMGCFTADKCRRLNASDRRNAERRIVHRRKKH